jgi:hypothetical protein
MKTSSFFTYTGPGRISIARYAPRHTPAGFRVFSPLAPGRWFNSVSRAEYERRFAEEVLAMLNPRLTWDLLHEFAGEGNEPFLMCWEAPPFTTTNWCHRRIVAQWFKDKLGYHVPEFERPRIRLAVDNTWPAAARKK